MIALDTNVLTRVFVNDVENPTQCQLARELVKKAKYVFISQNVQVELIWLLKQGYNFEKASIIKTLEHFLNSEYFLLENQEIFQTALDLYRNQNADFSDYMILSTAQKNHVKLWTFDKKLSKAENAQLLNEQNFINFI
nr:type II toxin-antitoxin system VapC family toxin [uncultured Moraxella sp.]